MKTKPNTEALGDILLEAHNIINGPRRQSYGDPRESFESIATIWSEQLKRKLTRPITAREVALMMIMLKCLRDRNPARDNIRDICGYAALAEEVAPTK